MSITGLKIPLPRERKKILKFSTSIKGFITRSRKEQN